MSYQIKFASEFHLPHLPEIEKAAATIFTEQDLPIEVRTQSTPMSLLFKCIHGRSTEEVVSLKMITFK